MAYKVIYDFSEFELLQNEIYDLLSSLGQEDEYVDKMELDVLTFEFDEKYSAMGFVNDNLDNGVPIIIQKVE